MATVTTLRPSSTSSGVGWSALPAGTLHGVTSDNSDATYALWSGSGSALILATPVDAPPAGERRHQVRVRARGEDGDAWWAARLGSGALVAGAAGQFPASPTTITGSWGFGAPADGSTVLYTYATGQSTGVKINELYLDVDTREAPTFTPQIIDGSGAVTTTVSDTSQPVVRADDVDLDDLDARQYRYWVTLNGAIVWDTGIVSGPATDRQTSPLPNGSYVAHLQVWSTLGASTPYPSDEETLTFTVFVGAVPSPDNPTVDPEDGTPFYRLEACAPYAGGFDGDVAHIEVQRVDCPVGGYLLLPGVTGSYASTPDPVLAPTDLQVTVSAQRDDDWRPAADEMLASQWLDAGNQRGWIFALDASGDGDPARAGRPFITWSPDGDFPIFSAAATERAPVDPFGRVTMRFLLDVDNGLGGWTVTFSALGEDGEWAVIGDPVTGAGTTAVFDNDQPFEVGAQSGGTVGPFEGRIYSAELRDGTDGPVLADPDFTGHLDGTTTFTDDQGNVWTVHSPASISTPGSTTTIAMLGPLETGECAEWVDYTLPRSGVGITCDHDPEPCCSYYRARTVGRVDGDLRISSWSDAYNPGMPAGLIMMWPGTNASIPDGWNRVTSLDGKYPKGVPNASTEPGSTGGAADHTHTVPTHLHDTSHAHTVTGNTGAATGTQVSTPNSAGATAILATHTHTRPAVNSATVSSGSSTPSIGTGINEPDRLEVLFIESDGTPVGVPDDAMAYMGDIAPAGWDTYAGATGRYPKGSVNPDGGGTGTSLTANHTHSIGAHSHAATSHTHTSSNTGTASSANTLNSGASAVLWQASHSHAITVGAADSVALSSGGSGNSDATSPDDPPYRNLRARQNTSGVADLPLGVIGLWLGDLGAIPEFWQLCDGSNGTPDMFGRYAKGATASIGSAGGSLNPHVHTSPAHSHSTSGHAHTETTSPSGATTSNMSNTSTVTVSTGTHTHSATNTNSTTPTVGNTSTGSLASTTTEPPYTEVAFVQLVEEPVPPPTPSLFCLNWSSDLHLIRSTGPLGPIWIEVKGKFEWDVDRPFTVASGVMGQRFVTSAPPGGRNLHMAAAVESEEELGHLRAVLMRPLVLISPSDADEVWAAPVAETVRIVKVGRIRQVTADFIGTGPQPGPQLADVP